MSKRLLLETDVYKLVFIFVKFRVFSYQEWIFYAELVIKMKRRVKLVVKDRRELPFILIFYFMPREEIREFFFLQSVRQIDFLE